MLLIEETFTATARLTNLTGPNFGGFVSSTTTIHADLWKLGQIKAGHYMKYKRVSLDEALKLRTDLEKYLNDVQAAIEKNDFASVSTI